MGSDPFEKVPPPAALDGFGGVEAGGLGALISVLTSTLIAGAGIFALFNFILAGYAFLGAADDPNKVAGAWARIYQSIIGLIVAAGAFVIAGIVGQLLFGDPFALTRPSISTP